ncbi:MAG: hypothetical protein CMH12_18510 [Maritimibacter sp.]|nr:hypothetical protein [Maritimibacter sp.]
MNVNAWIVGAAGCAALAGCLEIADDTGGGGGGIVSQMPSIEEQACARDVTRVTNNADVVVLSSSFSQAGTEVILGVGPNRARWRCIGYANGTTGEIMSLTDEGAA